jgi:hypothetical protein
MSDQHGPADGDISAGGRPRRGRRRLPVSYGQAAKIGFPLAAAAALALGLWGATSTPSAAPRSLAATTGQVCSQPAQLTSSAGTCGQFHLGHALRHLPTTAIRWDTECVRHTPVGLDTGQTVHPYRIENGLVTSSAVPFHLADVAHCATIDPTRRQCREWSTAWPAVTRDAPHARAVLTALGCTNEAP